MHSYFFLFYSVLNTDTLFITIILFQVIENAEKNCIQNICGNGRELVMSFHPTDLRSSEMGGMILDNLDYGMEGKGVINLNLEKIKCI